jgi:hypothetical protein
LQRDFAAQVRLDDRRHGFAIGPLSRQDQMHAGSARFGSEAANAREKCLGRRLVGEKILELVDDEHAPVEAIGGGCLLVELFDVHSRRSLRRSACIR